MADDETTNNRAMSDVIARFEQLSTELGAMLTRIREDVASGRIPEGSREHRDAFAEWAAKALEADAARRAIALAGGLFDADRVSHSAH